MKHVNKKLAAVMGACALMATALLHLSSTQAATDVAELAAAPAAAAPSRSPMEAVNESELGTLKNPYPNANDKILEYGRKRYLAASCNGCHGGTGGGGMCPPLTNEVWVYGSDDDTLFRLITLGSDELQKRYGMTRKGRENVVGPMPPHGNIVKSEDDMWKIIAFIRSQFRGDPANRNW